MQRKEAKALGLTTYDGKPCLYGHIGKRYVATCNCVDCNRIARKADTAYNSAYYTEYVKRWKKRDLEGYRECCKAKSKRFRERHPEKIAKEKAHQYAIKMTTLRLLYYT